MLPAPTRSVRSATCGGPNGTDDTATTYGAIGAATAAWSDLWQLAWQVPATYTRLAAASAVGAVRLSLGLANHRFDVERAVAVVASFA
jgi:hypothetical protein